MTPRNTIRGAALTLLLALVASCSGLATKNHAPLVFALNLSPDPVSLVLVKDSAVLVDFSNLAPLESRRLTRVPESDGAVLRHGPGGRVPTTEWTDPSGTPYGLKFQRGGLYAIVVDPQGQAALYTLSEAYTDDPKLCVVNTGAVNLSQVQAAPDWAKNVKVYIEDLAPVVPTEFYSIEPKTLGLFWQTFDQVPKGEHMATKGLDGKPLREAFLQGRYYLFLAPEGSVRDLTPNLD